MKIKKFLCTAMAFLTVILSLPIISFAGEGKIQIAQADILVETVRAGERPNDSVSSCEAWAYSAVCNGWYDEKMKPLDSDFAYETDGRYFVELTAIAVEGYEFTDDCVGYANGIKCDKILERSKTEITYICQMVTIDDSYIDKFMLDIHPIQGQSGMDIESFVTILSEHLHFTQDTLTNGAVIKNLTNPDDTTGVFEVGNDYSIGFGVETDDDYYIYPYGTVSATGIYEITVEWDYNVQTYKAFISVNVKSSINEHKHDYDIEYCWSIGTKGVFCTAIAVCKYDKCADYIEETVKATGVVTKQPTYWSKGQTTYTAEFENKLFSSKNKVLEDIPQLGTGSTEILIVNCQDIEVNYKSTVILTASTNAINPTIGWYNTTDDTLISLGSELKIENITEDMSVYSAVIDSANNPVVKSKTEKITVKKGFFQKLAAFFKGLFKNLDVWKDNVKE